MIHDTTNMPSFYAQYILSEIRVSSATGKPSFSHIYTPLWLNIRPFPFCYKRTHSSLQQTLNFYRNFKHYVAD
jgi:hypothetical protein